jgi:tripartite-type tricarboxylate transporter receptor subunit TctC
MTSISRGRRAVLKSGAAASLALMWPHAARAQEFPARPVRLITAFPPGSGPDAALRLVADGLSKLWKQQVIVDNKPGGAGFIAIDAFRSAAPDGHTMLQLDSNHLTTHPHVYNKLPYDPQRDLEPVRALLRNYFFVAVSSASPYQSLEDLVAAAKKAPGKLNYGSWFIGSPGHLGGLVLQSQRGIEMTHVPYKEMTQLYAAVATQEVDWALGSAGSAGPLVKAGRLRFLAFTGPQRLETYPQVPSVDETAASRGYDVSAWTGLFAPRGTPLALRNRIAADIARVLAAPEAGERYRDWGYSQFNVATDAYAQVITRETANWGGLIRKAGLRLD